jgi:cysteinyl-tRNA synthetase
LSASDASAALAAWERVDAVLGIGAAAPVDVPAEITTLMDARQEARRTKDFKRADAIRNELKSKGWVIDDTPKGPKAKRL